MNVRVIIKLAEQSSIKLYYFQEAIKLIFPCSTFISNYVWPIVNREVNSIFAAN